jgi:hypothetical protein
MNRSFALFSLLVLFLASAGCTESGPSLGTVSGQVTMDGKPLPNVAVTFVPAAAEGGSSATGKTDANGNYELYTFDRKGAPIGKHKVSVTTVNQGAGSAMDLPADSPEYAKQATGGGDDYSKVKPFVETIPAKYNSQTTLEHEVKSGSNKIDLPLTST